jgi:hypothetical protein
MMGGIKAQYDCIKALSETDLARRALYGYTSSQDSEKDSTCGT